MATQTLECFSYENDIPSNDEGANCEDDSFDEERELGPMEMDDETDGDFRDAVEQERRNAAYTYSDRHFNASVKDFLAESRFENRNGWTPEQVRAKLRERNLFLLKYVMTGNTDDMPDSWSISEPLMFSNVACNGYGGTGKTTAMVNFHMMDGGITPTAPTNRASKTYIGDLTRQTQPYAYDHTTCWTTWYKSLPIKFTKPLVQALLKAAGTNDELQASFTKVLKVGECTDAEATVLTREHVSTQLKHLHPLVLEMMHERITEFASFGGHRYRLTVTEGHPFHQPLDETFPVVRQLVEKEESLIRTARRSASGAKRSTLDVEACVRASLAAENNGGLSNEMKRKRVVGTRTSREDLVQEPIDVLCRRRRQAELVQNQDAYRSYVMYQARGSPSGKQWYLSLPPHWTLNYLLLSEEDGRSQGVMEILAKVDMMLTALIYNMVWQYDRVGTYISSGSTTQSSVINSAASPLQMIMCPARARDIRNTMVWQSELFRRTVNSFTCPETRIYRTVCETLEGNIPPDKHTFVPLLFREDYASRIIDPAHQTNGARFFYKHKDVRSYNKSMETRDCANICISDLIFVSSDVVLLDVNELRRTDDPDNPYGVSLVGLSTLTEQQAANNRARLWARKYRLYAGVKRQVKRNGSMTSVNLIATARQEAPPDVRGLTESEYSRVMREFCSADDEKNDAFHEGRGACIASDVCNPDELDQDLFTEDVIKEIRYEEYADRAGRSKMYTRRQNAMKRNKTGKDIAEGATVDIGVQGDVEETMEDQVTKVFVAGPACLMLSREEHMRRRIYANAICAHLGTGKRLSECTLSARGLDHEAEFVYDPNHDVVIEYATPDWDKLNGPEGTEKKSGDWEGFKASILDTSSGCMMHMLFKRPRRYTRGCTITDEETNTKLTLRGVQSTIKRISESHWINHAVPPSFRMLVIASLLDAFRRWVLTQHLNGEVNLMTHTHAAADELIDAILEEDSPTCASLATPDRQLLIEYKQLINEQVELSKGTVDQLTGRRVKMWPDIRPVLERLTRMLVGVRERHSDFARNQQLTIYVEEHPLYPTVSNNFRQVPMCSFYGVDIRLLGDGFQKATALERTKFSTYVPRLHEGAGWNEYGSEGYFEGKGLMKSVPQMIKWTISSWWPDLFFQSVATVLLDNMIIATNVPKAAGTIRWTRLFSHTHPEINARARRTVHERFGLMTRNQSAPISGPDANLYHQFFRMNRGELENLPRPFIKNGSRSGNCTNVIVKTSTQIYPHASQPRLRVSATGKPRYLTPAEYDRLCKADLAVTKIETSVIAPIMCPFIPLWGSTVDSSQGQTCPGKCMMDLQLVTSDHYLVALTRANDTRNTLVSSVQSAMQEAEKNCTESLKTELLHKRRQRAITGRWEYFR